MSGPVILLFITLGSLFLLGLLFWPESGCLARWRAVRKQSERVLIEDILKHIHKCEIKGRRPTIESMAGVIQSSADQVVRLLEEMKKHQFLQTKGEEFHLTGTGRRYALHIIRAHRLWERFLADETGVKETEWHRRAEVQEHALSPDEIDRLSTLLHHPLFDPHGDPIPTRSGSIIPRRGMPLSEAPLYVPLRIAHIEDEPEVVYAQLVAEGLRSGMQGRVTEVRPERISFWTEGEEHFLAPIVARNLSVVPVEEQDESKLGTEERLSDLKPGEKARILGISRACRGAERRRFMDLGILPGTSIEAELAGPVGDPRAYRVRGTLIALRRDQAQSIYIERPVEAPS